MNLPASQQLVDDHVALAEVLRELKTSLSNRDIESSHAKLDLFWARLAVHIRAEHLHLFPTILDRMHEAQSTVDTLRADHDFFMYGLARAMAILRDLLRATEPQTTDEALANVRHIVSQVEKNLVTHNELEETQIYRWASTVLNNNEQLELAARINKELSNRPPRFSADGSDSVW